MIRLKCLEKEWLSIHNKFYISPLVCINLKCLLFIIDNSDIAFLSSHPPTSPPFAPVLNAGLVSVGTEMTIACKIPCNLFAIKLILTFINFNLAADHVEGSVQRGVDFLQYSSSILNGSSLL